VIDQARKPCALVAEDDRALADIIRLALVRAGFQVTVAHNGKVALDYAAKQSFSAIISDYQMPGLNGEEFLTALREQGLCEQAVLLLCSAKGYEIDSERLRESLGLTAVFYKPFSLSELTDAVRAATCASTMLLSDA
jgi:DNA-binding response OmpR family regulator